MQVPSASRRILVRDAARQPHGLLGAFKREHAARIVAEAAASELASVQAALQQIDDGIVLLDKELRAIFINRAFRRMWRLPDETADKKSALRRARAQSQT